MSFVNNHLVILASSIFPDGVNKVILGKANIQ